MGLLALLTLVAGTLLVIHNSESTTPAKPSGTTAAKDQTRVGIAHGNLLNSLTAGPLDRTLDETAELNATWVREDLQWSAVQAASAETSKWDSFDRVVAAARERDLNVLPVLAYTPAWARAKGCTTDKCPPEDHADFARFAGAAAKRYSSLGVHTWEIWNRPNEPAFWTDPDPKKYAALVVAASTAIRKADPKATIILGGLSRSTSSGTIDVISFLDRVCDAGGCHAVDGIGYHPEAAPTGEKSSVGNGWDLMTRNGSSIRSLLDDHDLNDLKIWVTSFGLPLKQATPTSEATQAQQVESALREAAENSEIAAVFWYSLRDSDALRASGLVQANGKRKLSWEAFQEAAGSIAK